MNRQFKWDKRYLALSKEISSWSKDPSTKVGSIIVDPIDNYIISTGYNGFPIGVDDTEDRLNNREIKYKIIIHGERNALLRAHRPLKGCTLYVWPFMPCSVCAGMIIQSGIKRVVSVYNDNGRWTDDFELSKEIFKESSVELVLMDTNMI